MSPEMMKVFVIMPYYLPLTAGCMKSGPAVTQGMFAAEPSLPSVTKSY